jgi:CRP-like cAMP-binding protein
MTITPESLQNRFPQLLDKLNRAAVQSVLNSLERITATPGQVLYRYGEDADAFYLVWEGKVALSLTIAGEEKCLGTIGPGQFSGMAAVIDPGPALLSATVIGPSILLRLTHVGLVRLRATQPRVGSDLLRAFSLNLVNWLRTYEEYMAERDQPDNLVEFFRLGRIAQQP